MLDGSTQGWGGAQEHSQILLMQAVRSLEAAYSAHQNILRAAKNPSTTRELLRSDISIVDIKFKQTFHSLSLLHILLYNQDCDVGDGMSIYKNFKMDSAFVSDKISEVDTIISEIKINVPAEVKPEVKTKATADVKVGTEEVKVAPVITSELEIISPEVELSTSQTIAPFTPTFNLATRLKNFRSVLDKRCEEHGVVVPVIQALHELEKRFHIQRDSRTSSLWNMDHQQQRKIKFEESNEQIVYREKCECIYDDDSPVPVTADAEDHADDAYCPRNIKKDEAAIRKKTKNPTKKAKSDAIIQITLDHIGRQNIKDHFCKIRDMVSSEYRKPKPWEGRHFGMVLSGPGNTGKAVYARNYAKYLAACGISNDTFYEVEAKTMLTRHEPHRTMGFYSGNGGVLFLNNAHELVTFRNNEKSALEYILNKVAKANGKITLILSGYEEGINAFLAETKYKHLVPYILPCPAFKEEEVESLISREMINWFGKEAEVEDGWEGLYIRIAAKRIVTKEKVKDEKAPDFDEAVNKLITDIWTRHYGRLTEKPKKEEPKKAPEAVEEKESKQKETSSNGASEEIKPATKGSGAKNPSEKPNNQIPIDAKSIDSKPPDVSTPPETPQNGQSDPPSPEYKEEKPEEKKPEENETEESKPEENKSEDKKPEEKRPEQEISDLPSKLSKPNTQFTGPHLFTKDDILGPCPGKKMQESESWKKLGTLTGLEDVKKALLHLSELARTNYERELLELPPIDFTFNRLFLGPPGTGKTVVAKLYGQILAEMGVLSKGHLVVKNATALVGKYIGWSEDKTNKALEEAEGGVLVIDEAYTLGGNDVFRKAIITTLVGGIQNVPGEDRCVILVGYEDKMKKMISDANPGLARRFPMEDAFIFKDYTLKQLESIMKTKLEEYKLEATPDAIKIAMNVLDKAQAQMNFGNGGEVENLITRAKSNCLSRLIQLPLEQRPKVWSFEPQDFDPEYNRAESATTKLKALFADVVDCEPVIAKFEQYQIVSQAMKARDLDPRPLIPTTFVFKGPPGTGKTTTARKIAQVYYDMGFLSHAEVVECTVTDLIGSYVGQTGPKTIKALERGLGKVMFIDEAYRLSESSGSSGSFAREAISEMVDQLTKPKFMGKIIVILAGYEDEMNALLAMNPGLASRFSEEIIFKLITPAGCLSVLQTKLKGQGIEFPAADDKDGTEFKQLERLMRTLSNTRGWGNARDVETLGKAMSRKIFARVAEGKGLVCDTALAAESMEELLEERKKRNGEGDFLHSLYN